MANINDFDFTIEEKDYLINEIKSKGIDNVSKEFDLDKNILLSLQQEKPLTIEEEFNQPLSEFDEAIEITDDDKIIDLKQQEREQQELTKPSKIQKPDELNELSIEEFNLLRNFVVKENKTKEELDEILEYDSQQVYDYLKTQPELKEKDIIDKTTDVLKSTAKGLISSYNVGNFIEYVGFEETGKDIDKFFKDVEEEFLKVENPTFVDKVASGVGSTIGYFIPSTAIFKGAKLLSHAPKIQKLAVLTGLGASAVLETSQNAGDVYVRRKEKLMKQGLTEEQAELDARKKATIDFAVNLPANFILDKFIFGKIPLGKNKSFNNLLKNIKTKYATKAVMGEVAQENWQDIWGNILVGDDITAKQIMETSAVTAVSTLLFAGGRVLTSRDTDIIAEEFNEYSDDKILETESVANSIIKKAKGLEEKGEKLTDKEKEILENANKVLPIITDIKTRRNITETREVPPIEAVITPQVLTEEETQELNNLIDIPQEQRTPEQQERFVELNEKLQENLRTVEVEKEVVTPTEIEISEETKKLSDEDLENTLTYIQSEIERDENKIEKDEDDILTLESNRKYESELTQEMENRGLIVEEEVVTEPITEEILEPVVEEEVIEKEVEPTEITEQETKQQLEEINERLKKIEQIDNEIKEIKEEILKTDNEDLIESLNNEITGLETDKNEILERNKTIVETNIFQKLTTKERKILNELEKQLGETLTVFETKIEPPKKSKVEIKPIKIKKDDVDFEGLKSEGTKVENVKTDDIKARKVITDKLETEGIKGSQYQVKFNQGTYAPVRIAMTQEQKNKITKAHGKYDINFHNKLKKLARENRESDNVVFLDIRPESNDTKLFKPKKVEKKVEKPKPTKPTEKPKKKKVLTEEERKKAEERVEQRKKKEKEKVEKKKSRVASRSENALQIEFDEAKIKYETIEIEKEIAKAEKLVKENREKAIDIAEGIEESTEVEKVATQMVLAETALEKNNVEEYMYWISRRSQEQTERGQAIVLETARTDLNSPDQALKAVLNNFKSKFLADNKLNKQITKNKSGAKVIQEVVTKQKNKAKNDINNATKIDKIKNIIDDMRC